MLLCYCVVFGCLYVSCVLLCALCLNVFVCFACDLSCGNACFVVLVCVFMFPCLCVLFVIYGVMVYGLFSMSLLLFVIDCVVLYVLFVSFSMFA